VNGVAPTALPRQAGAGGILIGIDPKPCRAGLTFSGHPPGLGGKPSCHRSKGTTCPHPARSVHRRFLVGVSLSRSQRTVHASLMGRSVSASQAGAGLAGSLVGALIGTLDPAERRTTQGPREIDERKQLLQNHICSNFGFCVCAEEAGTARRKHVYFWSEASSNRQRLLLKKNRTLLRQGRKFGI
jgi:hypothetical protein